MLIVNLIFIQRHLPCSLLVQHLHFRLSSLRCHLLLFLLLIQKLLVLNVQLLSCDSSGFLNSINLALANDDSV